MEQFKKGDRVRAVFGIIKRYLLDKTTTVTAVTKLTFNNKSGTFLKLKDFPDWYPSIYFEKESPNAQEKENRRQTSRPQPSPEIQNEETVEKKEMAKRND